MASSEFPTSRLFSNSYSNNFDYPALSFSPQSISGLHAWYKGDAGVLNSSDVPASNGETVKTWQDQSGNTRHATQGTDADRPLYVTSSSINSKPALNFDGLTDYLKSTISVTTTTVTAFIVYRLDAITVASRVSSIVAAINADFNDSNSAILAYYASTTQVEGFRNPNDKSFKASLGAAPYNSIICSQWDSANHTLYYNSTTGQSSVASAEGSFNAVEWWIGGGRAGPGVLLTPVDCHIAEMILYTTSLTATDRNNVLGYLNSKYAVY